MIKDAVEGLYFDKCDVYEYEESTNPVTHVTSHSQSKVFENLPCRLVYKSITAAGMKCGAATVAQSTELITSPDYYIKPGSKIVVTKQTGQTIAYKSSGQPSFYPSHQQIMLELFEGWA